VKAVSAVQTPELSTPAAESSPEAKEPAVEGGDGQPALL